MEHPGKQIYQANKKILKAKAEEELKENFKPIYERRLKILETILIIMYLLTKNILVDKLNFITKKPKIRREILLQSQMSILLLYHRSLNKA